MGQHLHHLTGRAGPGAGYIHPALVLPLSPRAHVALHVALRAVGLDSPPYGADLLSYCRKRTAMQLRLNADVGEPFTFDAAAQRVLADLLDPPPDAATIPACDGEGGGLSGAQ
jgi:hypothetical protein